MKTAEQRRQQCMDALAAANETRLNRADMKRKIKAGRLRVSTVIKNPPWYAESMHVHELLMTLPRFGRKRATVRLTRAELPMTKTVGSMTERQRNVLVSVLLKDGVS